MTATRLVPAPALAAIPTAPAAPFRAAAPTEHLLAAGEVMHAWADAGTLLVIAQGTLQIDEAPRWLAETMVTRRAHCPAGQAHVVLQGGLLRLSAQGAAPVAWRQIAPPAPGWQRLLHRAAGLLLRRAPAGDRDPRDPRAAPRARVSPAAIIQPSPAARR